MGSRCQRLIAHLGRCRDDGGQILVEAMLIVVLLSLAAVAMAQILPLELGLTKSQEDYAKVHDSQDAVASWFDVKVAPASLPFDAGTGGSSIVFHSQAQDPQNVVCYSVSVDPDSQQLTLNWDGAVHQSGDAAGYWHCPSALTQQRVLAASVTNDADHPLLGFYSSSDSSVPIDNPSATDPSCTYPAPTAEPNPAAGAAGAVTGSYRYAISFVQADGESDLGPASSEIAVSGKQVDLSGLEAGPFGTSGRYLYRKRTDGGDGDWHQITSLDNQQTTYTDDVSDSTAEGNPTPTTPVKLAGGRCAKSLGLKLGIDFSGDRASNSYSNDHVVLGDAVVSNALADAAVTGAKVAGPFDSTDAGTLIGDSTISPAQLSTGASQLYDRIPLAVAANQNFQASASEVGLWRDNSSSPSAQVGALTLAAGDGREAAVVDWGQQCRPKAALEGRVVYTVLNPSAASVAVSLRLAASAGLGSSPAPAYPQTAMFATPTVTVGAGDYRTLESPWTTIDAGACGAKAYLIAASPFLYRVEANAGSTAAFTVVNARLELSWHGATFGGPDQDPLPADPIAPGVGGQSGHGIAELAARFVDPDPADTGRLHFEVCQSLACSNPPYSGTSRGYLPNGTIGTWGLSIAPGDYYWRVRGADDGGQLGPWSDPQPFTVVSG